MLPFTAKGAQIEPYAFYTYSPYEYKSSTEIMKTITRTGSFQQTPTLSQTIAPQYNIGYSPQIMIASPYGEQATVLEQSQALEHPLSVSPLLEAPDITSTQVTEQPTDFISSPGDVSQGSDLLMIGGIIAVAGIALYYLTKGKKKRRRAKR